MNDTLEANDGEETSRKRCISIKLGLADWARSVTIANEEVVEGKSQQKEERTQDANQRENADSQQHLLAGYVDGQQASTFSHLGQGVDVFPTVGTGQKVASTAQTLLRTKRTILGDNSLIGAFNSKLGDSSEDCPSRGPCAVLSLNSYLHWALITQRARLAQTRALQAHGSWLRSILVLGLWLLLRSILRLAIGVIEQNFPVGEQGQTLAEEERVPFGKWSEGQNRIPEASKCADDTGIRTKRLGWAKDGFLGCEGRRP